jgi:hypothetical protein
MRFFERWNSVAFNGDRPAQSLNYNGSAEYVLISLGNLAGATEARTRDLRRDRPIFIKKINVFITRINGAF